MTRTLALGFLVGLAIAASPGPMFFLVLRRTLARGRRSGLVSGFGVATGDAIYAALAAFGVAAVTNVLVGQRRWIGLVGGIGLVLIGLRGLETRAPTLTLPRRRGREKSPYEWEKEKSPYEWEKEESSRMRGRQYASMVALTLSNPATILSFTAVFAGLGVHVGSGWQPFGLVAGVMLGSALWWVVLTIVVSLVRERLTAPATRAIGIASGLVLVGFGALISLQSL